MRTTYLIPVLVILACLSTAASGFEFYGGRHAGLAGYGGCGCRSCTALSAPACGAPGYGLVPGCCEHAPSCCDNVWDGYCQESHCFHFPLFRGCLAAPRCGLGGCHQARPTCCDSGCDSGCESGCQPSCQPGPGAVDVIEEAETAPAVEAPQPPEEAPQA
jgi:hypothetical protein